MARGRIGRGNPRDSGDPKLLRLRDLPVHLLTILVGTQHVSNFPFRQTTSHPGLLQCLVSRNVLCVFKICFKDLLDHPELPLFTLGLGELDQAVGVASIARLTAT